VDLKIQNKVAIVTGASAGIGFSVAEEFLNNGVSVVMVARDKNRLEQSEGILKKKGYNNILTISADVSLKESADKIVDHTISKFQRLDILVNNAGRAHSGGLMKSSEADWESMTAVKISAMRRLCYSAIPHMKKNQWGRIVNMSSIGGRYPNPKLFISHVLSGAIDAFTKALALEIASDGILVNSIGIGAIATDNMTNNMIPALRAARPEFKNLKDDEILKTIGKEKTPIGRVGQPEEIAALAAFLASNRNGFITGDSIEASGGADRFL
jgi:3-oxoacyl-[acyl-carrier protein] reductase